MRRLGPPATLHAMATAEQIRVDARAAKLLTRLALAELARWSLENADVRNRLHRHRASRRDRAFKIGAVALGFAVAARGREPRASSRRLAAGRRAARHVVPGEGLEPSRPSTGHLILSQARMTNFATPAPEG